jgi:KDO2-lipid IV(A) lauroyltransferase
MKNKAFIKFFPFYAISIAPMFTLYGLSDILFVITFYIVRYRRKVVRRNLTNAFPHKSEEEIQLIEHKFYNHFCDLLIESIKGLTISKKEIEKRFIVKNPALIEHYFNENKSIILYAAHQGNWEWLSFLPLIIPHQASTFYQPLTNRYFDDLMKLIRSRFGGQCIESNKGYKFIIAMNEKGVKTLNCIIGDQSPAKTATKHWTQFLNQDTAFLIGADRIAKKSNQVLVFPAFTKLRRGYYELNFETIEEFPKDKDSSVLIDGYVSLLEKTILNAPELWLWSHNRWKLNK